MFAIYAQGIHPSIHPPAAWRCGFIDSLRERNAPRFLLAACLKDSWLTINCQDGVTNNKAISTDG